MAESNPYDDVRKAYEEKWKKDEGVDKDARLSDIEEELDLANTIDLRKLNAVERKDLQDYVDKLIAEKEDLERNALEFSDEESYERQAGASGMAADSPAAVLYRVQTEADIPRMQKKQLTTVRQLFGLHVPLSNTLRKDNIRHINTYNLAQVYMRIPKLRHMGVERMGQTTTELQVARSNEEVGGFERKAQISMIKRESMNISETPRKKPSMTERFLGVKKEQQPQRGSPPEA
jgi:hypothetical protein